MGVTEVVAWELLLAAFAGGAFGAAIGALQAFSLAGLMIIVGEVYALAHESIGAGTAPVDITGSIGFGVVLGPHIAFGGGAAAVAFAAKRGYLDTEFMYHDAKHITRGLGHRPDVLVIGGLFGMIGYVVATASVAVGLPTDPVALGVVGSAFIHRVVFDYSLIGVSPARMFDMSPFERGERRQPEGELIEPDGGPGRLVVEPWIPYQYRWSHVTLLGALVGIIAGYLAYLTGSAFLAFGISVVVLVFLCVDVAEIPVTHHMSMPASTVVIALANVETPLAPGLVADALALNEAIILGAMFGIIGAVLGEVAQRVFYAHAETHLDPPAASIVVTTLLISTLAWLGIIPGSAWIPSPA